MKKTKEFNSEYGLLLLEELGHMKIVFEVATSNTKEVRFYGYIHSGKLRGTRTKNLKNLESVATSLFKIAKRSHPEKFKTKRKSNVC